MLRILILGLILVGNSLNATNINLEEDQNITNRKQTMSKEEITLYRDFLENLKKTAYTDMYKNKGKSQSNKYWIAPSGKEVLLENMH